MDSLGQAWRTGWRRPDRREIFEWAADNVNLPAGVYTITGKFDVRNSRYLIKPFQALKDDRVRVVTLQFPVRAGKTLVIDIWLPWTLLNAPGPFMWNLNTETVSRRHWRTRVLPVFQGIPALRDILPLDPRQRSGQEIVFRNGVPFYIQGPSIDNLQGVGIRYLVESELWTRDAGRHEQAVGRLGDYERINASKLVNEGQGGIEDDDSDVEFRAGSQEEWMAICLGCSRYFIPVSSGRRADGSLYGLVWGTQLPGGENSARDKDGNWIKARVLSSVRYACPLCGHEHADCARTQREWNLRGDYVAQNPEAPASHRSFHIYATCTRSWHLLAGQLAVALNAYKGGILDPLMTYTQKRDALAWSEARLLASTASPTFQVELDGGTKRALQEWEACRILTVDHQESGVNWGLVVGVGKKGDLRRFAYRKLIGDEDIAALAEEWGVIPEQVAIDAADDTRRVYGWAVKYGWRCLWGDERRSWVHMVGKKAAPRRVQRSYSKWVMGDPESGTVFQGRRFAPLLYWSNPTIKTRFKGLIERGKIIEPEVDATDANEIAYREQMRGQWRTIVKNRVTGKTRFDWRDNGNDHARDCWNMAVVVATRKRLLPDIEETTEELTAEDAESAEEKSPEI